MLPIQSVYLLYRSLGEPHTARKFVQATCVMKNAHSPCYLKLLNKKIVKKLVNGTNAVPVGQSILYLPLDGMHVTLLLLLVGKLSRSTYFNCFLFVTFITRDFKYLLQSNFFLQKGSFGQQTLLCMTFSAFN